MYTKLKSSQAKLFQQIAIRKGRSIFSNQIENMLIVEVYSWDLGAILAFERRNYIQRRDYITGASGPLLFLS